MFMCKNKNELCDGTCNHYKPHKKQNDCELGYCSNLNNADGSVRYEENCECVDIQKIRKQKLNKIVDAQNEKSI